MIIVAQEKDVVFFVGNVNGFITCKRAPYGSHPADIYSPTPKALQLWFCDSDGKSLFPLGIYKSVERCLQIMQEIAKCASNGSLAYEMPKE